MKKIDDLIHSPRPSILEISGERGIPALGYFIMGFGVFLLLAGLHVIPSDRESMGGDNGLQIMIGAGITLTLIGLHFGFWSSHSTIDKSRDKLTYKSGLFGIGKPKEFRLSNFDTIKLAFTAGDSESSDEFRILLINAIDGTESPVLFKNNTLAEAHDAIDKVQGFLNWPVRDMTLGPIAYVKNQDVKENSEISNDLVSPSDTTSLNIHTTNRSITISYPSPNLTGQTLLSTSVPFFFVLVAFWDSLTRNAVNILIFLVVWVAVMFIGYIRCRQINISHHNKMTLSIDNNTLEIKSGRALSKPLHLNFVDIRSISLHANTTKNATNWHNKIVLQTHGERYEIARGLTNEDTQYIYQMIKNKL